VKLGQAFRERQAETGAFMLAPDGGINLPELGHRHRDFLFVHADAGVDHAAG
jgi:hypothetical protein